MEIILAFSATLLAIFIGILSSKGGFLVEGIYRLFRLLVFKAKKFTTMDNTKEVQKDVINSKKGSMSEFKDEKKVGSTHQEVYQSSLVFHTEDNDTLSFDSEEIHDLSSKEGDRPVKVKEFIRMLRENQQEDMTEEEKEEERRIQKEQLQEIFQLMQSSQNQYGINSLDDMEEQMKLYAVGH